MSSNSYAKGSRLERAVVEHLQSLGWEAKRQPLSKGEYGEDVIAWVPGWEGPDSARMFIQCKADSRKKAGKPVKQGMMQPKEWNRFLDRVPEGNYVLLANGTPTHIKYHRITGYRTEGLRGGQAAKDATANMEDFAPMDVWWLREKKEGEK